MQSFPNVEGIIVFPVKYGNEATLKFYKAIGFVERPLPESMPPFYGVPSSEMFLCMFRPVNKSAAKTSRAISDSFDEYQDDIIEWVMHLTNLMRR